MPVTTSSTPARSRGADSITTTNLGFPRIGRNRELKWALERYWRSELDAAALAGIAADLRTTHWQLQADHGIDVVPCGDFSLYDQVLDTAVTLGAVPDRFGGPFDASAADAAGLDRYFTMARGGDGVPALELTKWFDTNYHYLVPELAPDQRFHYASPTTARQFTEAREQGFPARPVVIGPVTSCGSPSAPTAAPRSTCCPVC